MLVRVLFALLALAALVILVSPPPGNVPEAEPLQRKLLLVAILVTSLGMAVQWGRWVRIESPRGNLAFVSKLLGWSGASALPLYLDSEEWLVAGVCALLPVCALGMWKERAWAAWPWYAVALGAFAISITIAIEALPTITSPPASGLTEPDLVDEGGVLFFTFRYVVPLVWILCWGLIGFVLAREVTSWRRRLQSQSGAPQAPPPS